MFPQIALAIGVLSSSIGVRVRRFCGFVLGGLSGRVLSDVCTEVRIMFQVPSVIHAKRSWRCNKRFRSLFSIRLDHKGA